MRPQRYWVIGDYRRIGRRDDLEDTAIVGFSYKAQQARNLFSLFRALRHVFQQANAIGSYRIINRKQLFLIFQSGWIADMGKTLGQPGVP